MSLRLKTSAPSTVKTGFRQYKETKSAVNKIKQRPLIYTISGRFCYEYMQNLPVGIPQKLLYLPMKTGAAA